MPVSYTKNGSQHPLIKQWIEAAKGPAHNTTAKVLHRLILVAIIIFGIISRLPALGFIGALGVKALAILDLVALSPSPSKKNWKTILSICGKIVGVALGILGLVLALVPLSIAAFGVDLAYQIIGLYQDRSDPGLIALHIGFIIVDTLALAAVITGGWQLAVAAASISAVVMLGVALYTAVKCCVTKADVSGSIFDTICYIALAGLCLANAITSAKITNHHKKSKFQYHNDSQEDQVIETKNGKVLGVVHPGESKEFSIDRYEADHLVVREHTEMRTVRHMDFLASLLSKDNVWYYTQEPFTVVDERSPPAIFSHPVVGESVPIYGCDITEHTVIQHPVLPAGIVEIPFFEPAGVLKAHATRKD